LDALSSKGVLLLRLPVALGGDAPRGEKMLERVVREDSTCITARITLADVYGGRGARADAIALAAQASPAVAARQKSRPRKRLISKLRQRRSAETDHLA